MIAEVYRNVAHTLSQAIFITCWVNFKPKLSIGCYICQKCCATEKKEQTLFFSENVLSKFQYHAQNGMSNGNINTSWLESRTAFSDHLSSNYLCVCQPASRDHLWTNSNFMIFRGYFFNGCYCKNCVAKLLLISCSVLRTH